MMKSHGLPPGITIRKRPKSYEASDAAFSVGGNKGTYVARLPRAYPATPQQRAVKVIAYNCGIKKGMDKKTMQNAMVDCVGPEMLKFKETGVVPGLKR